MKSSQVRPQRSSFCPNRSGYAGAPRPHSYTSTKTVNDEAPLTICSWCGMPKKGKKR
jgi:hypothetical protein